jgi:ACS family glucarate transporter-like MFS transporter
MRQRYKVLTLLFVLSMITFLDRVCLSVAGPRMQSDLHISPEMWGWVVGVFAISYGLFQIPSGVLGDRWGARKILVLIVCWWSVFTFLTGSVTSVPLLLVTRFLFGAGEGGAYPNSSAAISRWFPATERARSHGVIWTASRLGGAVTPLLIIPLQYRYGWRIGFHFLGVLGILWALAWFLWFRDRPSEMPMISKQELEEIGEPAVVRARQPLPWKTALRSLNLWYILIMYHFFGYTSYFYLSWLNTYLVSGRGFEDKDIIFLSALPFFAGALGNFIGGFAGDFIVTRIGVKWGRRAVGSLGMTCSAAFTLAAALSANRVAAIIFLALGAGAADFLLPTCWATCLDIAKKYTASVTATMNAAGQLGSFVSGVLFGYAVTAWHSYDLPLIPMAAISVCGAVVWLKIDATQELIPETSAPKTASMASKS